MYPYPDFMVYVSEYHTGLLKFLTRFEEIGPDEVAKAIKDNPEIKPFLDEALKKYNVLTSEAYFENSTRPYDYEDKNGFRYDSSGRIVRYPKSLYEEAREEYLRIRQEIKKFIDID